MVVMVMVIVVVVMVMVMVMVLVVMVMSTVYITPDGNYTCENGHGCHSCPPGKITNYKGGEYKCVKFFGVIPTGMAYFYSWGIFSICLVVTFITIKIGTMKKKTLILQ